MRPEAAAQVPVLASASTVSRPPTKPSGLVEKAEVSRSTREPAQAFRGRRTITPVVAATSAGAGFGPSSGMMTEILPHGLAGSRPPSGGTIPRGWRVHATTDEVRLWIDLEQPDLCARWYQGTSVDPQLLEDGSHELTVRVFSTTRYRSSTFHQVATE